MAGVGGERGLRDGQSQGKRVEYKEYKDVGGVCADRQEVKKWDTHD